MPGGGVNCMDCHQAEATDPDAIKHEGQIIATIVSPKDCARCHEVEFRDQQGSVHAEAYSLIKDRIPALADNLTGVAVHAAAGCDQCHGSRVKVKGDGTLDPDDLAEFWHRPYQSGRLQGLLLGLSWPASLLQGPGPGAGGLRALPFRPRLARRGDLRGLQARHDLCRPAASNESGCTRMGRRASDYTAAPTCATCHMGAAGKLPSTHDVGHAQCLGLNSPVSQRQYLVVLEDGGKLEIPAGAPVPKRGEEIQKLDGGLAKVKAVVTPERRRQAMSLVCLECHSKALTQGFMKQFDDLVELFNTKFARAGQGHHGRPLPGGLSDPARP